MRNLAAALRTVFPSLAEKDVVPDMRLGDCPNWDSMNAVNLVMEIETACGAKMGTYEPKDDARLADVVAVIVAAGGTP